MLILITRDFLALGCFQTATRTSETFKAESNYTDLVLIHRPLTSMQISDQCLSGSVAHQAERRIDLEQEVLGFESEP